MKQNVIDTQRRYMAANTYRMELRLHNRNDADIIEFLESKGKGRTQTIKEALRSQMIKENFNVCNKENGE